MIYLKENVQKKKAKCHHIKYGPKRFRYGLNLKLKIYILNQIKFCLLYALDNK